MRTALHCYNDKSLSSNGMMHPTGTLQKSNLQPRSSNPRVLKMTFKILAAAIPVLVSLYLVRNGRVSLPSQVAGPPSISPDCLNPPLNNCSFYANCLEVRYNCGPTGYPIGYGQSFCEKFVENRTLFNAAGQTWMENTMHCLQLALVPDATLANATTCQALEEYAFGTHAGCYVNNGVCQLGLHDWEAILEVVDIKTLFASWDAFKATVQAADECLGFWAFMVGKKMF